MAKIIWTNRVKN